jgi:hypothetical protein
MLRAILVLLVVACSAPACAAFHRYQERTIVRRMKRGLRYLYDARTQACFVVLEYGQAVDIEPIACTPAVRKVAK